MSTSFFSPQGAADHASQVLGRPISKSSVIELVRAHGLAALPGPEVHARIDAHELDRFLADVHLPTGVDVLRVSVLAARPDTGGTRCLSGEPRPLVGVDYASALPMKVQRLGWEGVWPLREQVCSDAASMELPLIPSLRGWVKRSTVRRVVGYALEPGGTRRWLVTGKARPGQQESLFGSCGWAHIKVPKGSIAARQTV